MLDWTVDILKNSENWNFDILKFYEFLDVWFNIYKVKKISLVVKSSLCMVRFNPCEETLMWSWIYRATKLIVQSLIFSLCNINVSKLKVWYCRNFWFFAPKSRRMQEGTIVRILNSGSESFTRWLVMGH